MHTLSLRAGDVQVDLCPGLGGALTGMWCGGLPVLRSRPTPTSADATLAMSVRESACYPLVPYSNRIANARLHWDGKVWPLTPNFAPEPHAIHGTGWRAAWDVLDVGDSHVSLQHTHASDGDWPFAFQCQQHLSVDPTGLSLRLVFANTAAHAAPCGLGWHPYFAKDSQTQIKFVARTRWEMGPDKLPTLALPHPGLAEATANLIIDHCFSAWTGEAQLMTSHFDITVTSSLRHVVVFTSPDRNFIAIEPASHVNNALGAPRSAGELAALGVVVLGAGETFEATMRIDVQPRY